MGIFSVECGACDLFHEHDLEDLLHQERCVERHFRTYEEQVEEKGVTSIFPQVAMDLEVVSCSVEGLNREVRFLEVASPKSGR